MNAGNHGMIRNSIEIAGIGDDMIRFINIGDQICKGSNHFAFYNTITDNLIEIEYQHVFDGYKDFLDVAIDSKNFDNLDRLIPSDIKQKFPWDQQVG